MSAPASVAARASSRFVMPQIFIRVIRTISLAQAFTPGQRKWNQPLSAFFRSLSKKPRSGEMFIEHQTELRSGSSFRSETEYLSPVNGLLASSLVPFYKHRIPTGFFRQTPEGGR